MEWLNLVLCLFHSLWSSTFGGSGCWAGCLLPSGYLLSLSGREFAPLVLECSTWLSSWNDGVYSNKLNACWIWSHLSILKNRFGSMFRGYLLDSSKRLSFVFPFFSNIKFLYILGFSLSIYKGRLENTFIVLNDEKLDPEGTCTSIRIEWLGANPEPVRNKRPASSTEGARQLWKEPTFDFLWFSDYSYAYQWLQSYNSIFDNINVYWFIFVQN